jgi:hypothetical protein
MDLKDPEELEVTTLSMSVLTPQTTTQYEDDPLAEEPLHWKETIGCFRLHQTHLLL